MRPPPSPTAVFSAPTGPAWSNMAMPPMPAPRAGALPVRPAPARDQYPIGFFFFALVNAVLFIRPPEIFPALEGYPIYNMVMVACLIACLPVVLRQLSWRHLRSQPATLCVVALLPAIWLSLFLRGLRWEARDETEEFAKVLIYFLLLTGLVNTPARLRRFAVLTTTFVIAIAALALLNYYNVFELNGITVGERLMGYDPETGAAITVPQLYGPGIFSDPNDFSLILAFAIILLVHGFVSTRRWIFRALFAAAMVIPGTAFALTNSRGGFLALTAGIVTLAIGRFGWKKSIPLIAVALPGMLVLFAGRMTDVSLSNNDTAQGRMALWRYGFTFLKQSWGLGIGCDQMVEYIKLVAHNSFVQGYAELGILGGSIFTACFFIPLSVLWRKRPAALGPMSREEANLEWWRAGLLAAILGYAVGLCSLTKTYTVSTYMIVGIGAAYCGILGRYRPWELPVFNLRYARKLLLVGVGFLLFFYVWCKVM